MRLIFHLLALLSLAVPGVRAADAPEARKPNIVFFLIDDLGYADCGFNGGKDIKTPNIDKLAQGGTILDSLYVQPVCSPTRAALMTGRYPTRTGVYTIVKPHAAWGLPLGERTLANALRDAGYETAITGKWHLGEFDPKYVPTARGFDHQYGHYFGAIDYFTHTRGKSEDWYRDGKPLKEEGYSTKLVSNEACRLIAEKDKAKPLFLYVPFNGVHSPMQAPEEYLKPYADLKGGRQKLAGMLSAVDDGIGRIVAALEKAGLRDNTLIVFSTDNGGPRPGLNTPLRAGKGTIYEGGVRGCGFVNWPGHVAVNAHLKEPMHTVDWYPTLVTLAGGSLEQKTPLDGRDVWLMLTKGAPSPHDAILSVGRPGRAAVRMGDWKLLMNASEVDDEEAGAAAKPEGKAKGKKGLVESQAIELYNLANDIGEKTNLADKEPERVAKMRAKLAELLKGAVPPGNLNHEGSGAAGKED
ncbi:arylsulfatase [Luteolibacter sp. LG18]|uniref:arylsulfatase B n=1 Tax=Luteolibacter sp. LG18 TaxID=2819286 RepID=UPI002B282AE4|nr:N-acetylgalactosamine-6-sulfatase [Luteolibacter sp. LG18]